jgi:hypothetical protein
VVSNADSIGGFADQWYGVKNLIHEQSFYYALTLNLFQELGQFNASDARDHVYAILGLYLKYSGIEEIPPALIPNYEAPLADAFRQACKLCCLEGPNLGALMKVSHRSEEDMDGWPTWVPRWEKSFDPIRDAVPLDAASASLHADDGYDSTLPILEFSGSDNLIVRGLVEGDVTSVTPAYTRASLDSMQGVQDLFQSIDRIVSPSASARAELSKPDDFALVGAFLAGSRLAKEGEAATYHQAFMDFVAEINTLPPRVAELRSSSNDR